MMKRFTLAAALVATVAMTGAANATTVTWVGGNGTWYLGTGVWQTTGAGSPGSALSEFGRTSGWRSTEGTSSAEAVINDGSTVYYNGDTAGDFRWRANSLAEGAGVTISNGSVFNMETDVFADGAWMQFDSRHFTITGAGSLFNRFNTANVTAGTGTNGGAMIMGSWKSYAGQVTDWEVLDGAEFRNKGQTWWGAYGDEENGMTITMTIGNGAKASNDGALENGVSNDDSAGAGNEGELNFIYSAADSVTSNSNDYNINFTGDQGQYDIGQEGIRVQINAGGWSSALVTWEDLYNGVATGQSADDAILSHDGNNGNNSGATFADYFSVTNNFAGGTTLDSHAGVLQGGARAGDLNQDGFRDGADFGIIAGNFGAGAYDTLDGDINWTAASGTGGDGLVDAADIGVLFGNWTGDPPEAAPGTATAEYNASTGEVIVDVDSVVNWYVEHVGFAVMTGDAPAGLDPGNGLITDNDVRIGQSGFAPMSYDQLNLGAVASGSGSNMRIFWNATLGGELQSALVSVIPEPTTLALAGLGLCGVLASRRRR